MVPGQDDTANCGLPRRIAQHRRRETKATGASWRPPSEVDARPGKAVNRPLVNLPVSREDCHSGWYYATSLGREGAERGIAPQGETAEPGEQNATTVQSNPEETTAK